MSGGPPSSVKSDGRAIYAPSAIFDRLILSCEVMNRHGGTTVCVCDGQPSHASGFSEIEDLVDAVSSGSPSRMRRDASVVRAVATASKAHPRVRG